MHAKFLKILLKCILSGHGLPRISLLGLMKLNLLWKLKRFFFKEGYKNSLEEICTSVEIRAMQNLKIQL